MGNSAETKMNQTIQQVVRSKIYRMYQEYFTIGIMVGAVLLIVISGESGPIPFGLRLLGFTIFLVIVLVLERHFSSYVTLRKMFTKRTRLGQHMTVIGLIGCCVGFTTPISFLNPTTTSFLVLVPLEFALIFLAWRLSIVYIKGILPK